MGTKIFKIYVKHNDLAEFEAVAEGLYSKLLYD